MHMNLPLLATAGLKKAFQEYAQWLLAVVGTRKAALRLNKDIDFFVTLDKYWQGIPAFDQLLSHYGTSGLRRLEVPIRWLEESGKVKIDSVKKSESSEARRLSNLLCLVPESSPSRLIAEKYLNQLIDKVVAQKITIRTARLCAKPAVDLLRQDPSQVVPTQGQVTAYLIKSPGQANSLSGFLRFLNRNFSTELKLVGDPVATSTLRRSKLEASLFEIFKNGLMEEVSRLKWIVFGIEYFHGFKISRKQVLAAEVVQAEDGLIVRAMGRVFWLPSLNRL